MQNFGDFKEFVERNSTIRSALTKKWSIREEAKHLLFIIAYPDKLEWDFSIEKQTQTTTKYKQTTKQTRNNRKTTINKTKQTNNTTNTTQLLNNQRRVPVIVL